MGNQSKSSLFKQRNFRLLTIGETVSSLGDQFTLIALPWLVLKISNDPARLGLVMALAAVPRAILMLLGGAVADRFSPRATMLVSNLGRLLLVLTMGVIAVVGITELWMVYVFALLFGVADAFFIPAQNSIVPRVAARDQIGLANTVVQGINQLSQFAGPFLVGVLIGVLDHRGHTNSVGYAFLFDSVTFLISVVTLALISLNNDQTNAGESILESIKSGLSLVWRCKSLRYLLIVIAGVNFFLVGPFLVGIPVVAKSELPGGAAAYGIIIAMMGIGTLVGFILAGALPSPREDRVGSVITALVALMGVALIGMGWAHSTLAFASLSFAMSVANGYVSLVALTMIQQSFPEKVLGRLMSIITFSGVGLLPVSEAISGVVLRYGSTVLFVGSGLLYVLWVLAIGTRPEVRRIGVELKKEYGAGDTS